MVESFEDLNDDNDRDDGGYPAPDDNDDVTNWRGRECGQIVFYYPSMTICVRALLCNFKLQCTMRLSPLKSCIKEFWSNASLSPHFPSV